MIRSRGPLRRTGALVALVVVPMLLVACAPTEAVRRSEGVSRLEAPRSRCHAPGDHEDSSLIAGTSIFAVRVGTGERSVVIVPDRAEGHCVWMPLARRLARNPGLSVWVLDPAVGTGPRGTSPAPGPDCVADVGKGLALATSGFQGKAVVVGAGSGAAGALRWARQALTFSSEWDDILGLFAISPRPCQASMPLVPAQGVGLPIALAYGTGDAGRLATARRLSEAGYNLVIDELALPTPTQQGALAAWDAKHGDRLRAAIEDFALAAPFATPTGG